MEAMRQSWTDDRMDDLAKRVDDGFARVDTRFVEVRAEIAEVRTDCKEIRSEMTGMATGMVTRQDLDAVSRRLDTMQWTINGAILTGFVSLIVTQFA